MAGKYRPIGVAEKRAMLEAAGEEWPIGSDGLPKVWNPLQNKRGGSWLLRSLYEQRMKRANERRKYRRVYDPAFSERERQYFISRYHSDPAYRARALAADRLHRRSFVERGMCGYCRKRPLATQDGYGCNKCLDKKISPPELLKARQREAIKRRRTRTHG